MSGYEVYRLRSGLAGKYRIGLNVVRTGEIGVKGLFLEYDEYSAEYSPTILLLYTTFEAYGASCNVRSDHWKSQFALAGCLECEDRILAHGRELIPKSLGFWDLLGGCHLTY